MKLKLLGFMFEFNDVFIKLMYKYFNNRKWRSTRK